MTVEVVLQIGAILFEVYGRGGHPAGSNPAVAWMASMDVDHASRSAALLRPEHRKTELRAGRGFTYL